VRIEPCTMRISACVNPFSLPIEPVAQLVVRMN
jgi:hypothetical protein